MIDNKILFEEIRNSLILGCDCGLDTNELAQIAEMAIAQYIPIVSVRPEYVAMMWAWMEKSLIKIIPRFSFESDISKLSENINTIFKKGASGAQILVSYSDLPKLVSSLLPIRDDLFFNKDLMINLDINEIGPFDWLYLFGYLDKIRADALVLGFSAGKKFDAEFVGRVYSLMSSLPKDFDKGIHFALGTDASKIEQVVRLTQKMQPELSKNIRFIIGGND